MIINAKRDGLKKTKVYDTYWQFACERQNIFMRKLMGSKCNLTNDMILREYKFTNAYRASDRVSQYLIRNVIYQSGYTEEDTIFRILLFKTFNNIETWEKLEHNFGILNYRNFDIEQYGKVLNDYYDKGEKLYSGAYIMASGKTTFGQERKFMNHLMLIDYMMKDHITKKVIQCRKLEELYNTLSVDGMLYSVPYEYIKKKVDIRVTDTTIEIFYNHNRIASHRRLKGRPGQYSTITEHMPADHQKYLEWNGDRFRKWAERIGINTYTAVNAILTSKSVEQQTYRSCMGLLKLAEKYSDALLEAACKKALSYTASPSYKSIKNLLVTGSEKLASEAIDTKTTHKAHGITRGADYYRR